MLTKEEMLQMLRKNVVPAFGCTEPVCVALAAAAAAGAAGGDVQSVHVRVSGNIYKNGMAVGIPNFDKMGIHYAAALGAYLKNPERSLELLQDITPDIAKRASALAESGNVAVDINKGMQGVYVKCAVKTDRAEGEAVITQSHANIVSVKVDGKPVFEKEDGTKAADPLLEKLRSMKIAEIRALVDSASEEELAFVLDDRRDDEIGKERISRACAPGADHAPRGQRHGRPLRRLSLCGHEQRRQRKQGDRRDHSRGGSGKRTGELPGDDGKGHRFCPSAERIY